MILSSPILRWENWDRKKLRPLPAQGLISGDSEFKVRAPVEPCVGCEAALRATFPHVTRFRDHWWKDSHWPTWSLGATAFLPSQICSEYLFFKKSLVIVVMFLQVVWCLLLKGKTRLMTKTWHCFWLIPHRKSGFLTKFCWSKWNKGHHIQHSMKGTVLAPGCLQMFMGTFRSNTRVTGELCTASFHLT